MWSNLRGSARLASSSLKANDFAGEGGLRKLLKYLASTPLARQPLPDAYRKIDAYRGVRRGRGETAADYVLREQRAYDLMLDALRKLRRRRLRRERQRRSRRDRRERSDRESGSTSGTSESPGDLWEDVYTASAPEKGKDGGKTRQTPSAVGSGSGVIGDEAILPTKGSLAMKSAVINFCAMQG